MNENRTTALSSLKHLLSKNRKVLLCFGIELENKSLVFIMVSELYD